jgi:hypothetical protein
VVINSVLLFVVLFYIYPLKFLSTALTGLFFGLGPGAEKPMLTSRGEMASLMLIYGFGFIAVFACFSLLYLRAARSKELELDEVERLDARSWMRHYLIFVGVGGLSVLIVLVGGPLFLSGVIYGLLGPLCHWNGRVARRRSQKLEEQRLAA